jgi:glycosyltransferase involved in cell wall biosynthesis
LKSISTKDPRRKIKCGKKSRSAARDEPGLARLIKVSVIHSSFRDGSARWIDDFVEPSYGYLFQKIFAPTVTRNWHDRGKRTPFSDWVCHFRQAYTAIKTKPDVIIANFPQLIFAACLLKIFFLSQTKIVGWSFNFGPAAQSRLAPLAGLPFRMADILIVHSQSEVDYYARSFRLPKRILKFIPLQRGRLTVDATRVEIPQKPYVIAMGSAARDYKTLFRVAAQIDIDVIVVAKPEAVSGLEKPANLRIVNGLSLEQSWTLAAHANAMVLTLTDAETAAGQVTFLAALQLRVPLIATDGTGTRDYLHHGETALLVAPGDAAALQEALVKVLKTPALSKLLAENGYLLWEKKYSDEAIAGELAGLLDQVCR